MDDPGRCAGSPRSLCLVFDGPCGDHRSRTDMTERALPATVVVALNALGFALLADDVRYTFQRISLTGELRLRVRAVADHRWLIRIECGPTWEGVRLLPTFPGMSPTGEGMALELGDAELRERLPKMLATSVLPTLDSSWHEG